METNALYHHLTPRVYMKPWYHKENFLYVVKKGVDDLGTAVNTKKKFAGIDDYHTIRAGYLVATEEECAVFFSPLKDFKVYIEGDCIEDNKFMNAHFNDYKNWTIRYKNGNIVSPELKEELRAKILGHQKKDIEVNWNLKYEKYWHSIRDTILKTLENNTTAETIPAINREMLIRFFVSLKWRSLPYPRVILEITDEIYASCKNIPIPNSERLLPFLETAYDELMHNHILSLFRKYLNETGAIWNEARFYIDNSTIELLIAPSDSEFISSDNSVCSFFTNPEGRTEFIFPLTPNVLCAIRKGLTDKYLINRLTKNGVTWYNNHLKINCYQGYFLRRQNREIYFGKG
ncbi:DUF4238 domain-containing protein [Paenibacillus solisilvae]|uniref:DUF4238 domain-containing protein n=1 Tax=Paenibacillus solisilvae TaxID=2486751 RepID=A0ABW0VZQ1_9BACL